MVSSMDRWSILSFCQRLIHYSARFPGGEIQHIFLFNHVCQLWFYQGYVSHSFTQVFSVPVHKWNHLSIAKTAACTCLRWTKFLGNYPDQWLWFRVLLFRSHFFSSLLHFFVSAVNHSWSLLTTSKQGCVPAIHLYLHFCSASSCPTCQNDTHCWPCFLFSTGKLIGFSGLNQQSMSVSQHNKP